MPRLFCFGLGYSAAVLVRRLRSLGWDVAGTARSADKVAALRADGIPAWKFDGDTAMADAVTALAGATHVLVSAAPGAAGDPVLQHHGEDLRRLPHLEWVGYLSTTGVYGDHGGAWVDETSLLKPLSARSRARAAAETAWLASGLAVQVFRLAGIYGPGRSVIDDLRAGKGRRIDRPGHMFSRIHVEDIATVLQASMQWPNPGAIYNVCDDEPAESAAVTAYAAELIGIAPPPLVPLEEANMSPMALSFWADHKRVRNDRIKSELGVRFDYPTYREGLQAIIGR